MRIYTSGFHTRRFECGHILQVATLVVQSYELGNSIAFSLYLASNKLEGSKDGYSYRYLVFYKSALVRPLYLTYLQKIYPYSPMMCLLFFGLGWVWFDLASLFSFFFSFWGDMKILECSQMF